MDAHSGTKMEAHSGTKMEAQNWRLNMFFAKSSQQSNAIAQRWALQKNGW